jgi:hypothetical protein
MEKANRLARFCDPSGGILPFFGVAGEKRCEVDQWNSIGLVIPLRCKRHYSTFR